MFLAAHYVPHREIKMSHRPKNPRPKLITFPSAHHLPREEQAGGVPTRRFPPPQETPAQVFPATTNGAVQPVHTRHSHPRNVIAERNRAGNPLRTHGVEQRGKPFGDKHWLDALRARREELEKIPDIFSVL